MINKPALIMNMPEGKLPGFYAQIVKALANKVQLWDRDKETLIVNNEEELLSVQSIMDHYRIQTERAELLMLPSNAELTPLFSDFGFVTRAENVYLYLQVASVFRFAGEAAAGDRAQALMQMDEHLLARFPEDGFTYYIVESHLEELMRGIAKAYGCDVTFVKQPS